MKKMTLIVVALLSAVMTGCMGPAKVDRIVNAEPNERVFVTNLEGDSLNDQKVVSALASLQEDFVQSKRISIPQKQHDIGRTAGAYTWIPTVSVTKVVCEPLTCTWDSRQQALEVESLDSINFSLGATLTCRIEREDTPLFLYYFGAKVDDTAEEGTLVYRGRSLKEIADSNIHSFCQARLSAKFAKVNLNEGKAQKAAFFDETFAEAAEYFKQQGITIDSFGSTKGLYYHNADIQTAINEKYVAEMDIEKAKNEFAAQTAKNETLVAQAIAKREAAEAYLQQKEAVIMQIALQIRQFDADTAAAMADKWDGQLPSQLLPASGSNSLLLQAK